MNIAFIVAAALSFFTCGVHFFAGGREVARPLLASTALPPASKWLNYYCWHIVTILLLAMAAGFAWSALHVSALALAVFLTALALACSVLSAWTALKGGVAPLKFPSTSLFALIALAGGFGVIQSA